MEKSKRDKLFSGKALAWESRDLGSSSDCLSLVCDVGQVLSLSRVSVFIICKIGEADNHIGFYSS